MIRTLFASTAIAAILSVSAVAQETPVVPAEPTPGQQLDNAIDNAGDAMDNAGDAIQDAGDNAGQAVDNAVDGAGAAVNDAASNIESATHQPFDLSAGYTAGDGDAIVSDILGSPIYSSTAEDAEEIGTVNDLVVSVDGDIHAVVIGVGGFLGIGEKNVAVDFASLEYAVAFDQTDRWVLATTAEALTAAPDFVWEDDVADPALAPADPAMTPADPAMTPAPAPVTAP